MTEKAEKLWIDFRERGFHTDRVYERLFELARNPDEIYSFVKEYLANYSSSSTLFNDSLSHITKGQFEELVVISLEILNTEKNELAESVIEYCNFQFPEILNDNLVKVLDLKNEQYFNYSYFPGRNLEEIQIKNLISQFLSKEISEKEKQKIFVVLIQTRNINVVEIAFNYALEYKLFDNLNLKEYLLAFIENVGLTIREDKIISYCPSRTYHFVFPNNYFSNNDPIWLNKTEHPTWKLEPTTQYFKFGGYIDKDKTNPFFHLVTFDNIPEEVKVTNLKRLTLGLHINLVNEHIGPFFYSHDGNGKPSLINNEIKYEIQNYDDCGYVEREIAFSLTPSRWKVQDWGLSNSRENLFRLGGEPTVIQNPEILTCPYCNGKMDFLMQLDSAGDFFWATGGICYIFWCDNDNISGYNIQWT